MEPTAHDEQHHQAKGLCMGTPTRHGSRWSLKDLKDAPSKFLSNALIERRNHECEMDKKAVSS